MRTPTEQKIRTFLSDDRDRYPINELAQLLELPADQVELWAADEVKAARQISDEESRSVVRAGVPRYFVATMAFYQSRYGSPEVAA